MKHLLILAVIISAPFFTRAQSYQTLTDRDSSKMLAGFINDSLLKNDSAFKWFNKAQTIYNPKEKVVKAFAANKDSTNLIIFMGTWCGDSHFIIPRFYKILDSAGFNKSRVTLIAVDRTKKDKTNLAAAFNITNVPTIIVLKKGKETGRVVEYGDTGRYDEELASILTKSL